MTDITYFLSDLHLVAKKAKAEEIDQFLKTIKPELTRSMYLVGDIVDVWRFKQALRMGKPRQNKHLKCIDKFIRLANKGVNIHYLWGNHDEFLARFEGSHSFGGISLSEMESYRCSKGKKYLILHGHQFDLMSRYKLFGKLGDRGYDLMIWINEKVNRIRMALGMKYWSLSKYMKVKVKKATQFVDRFESLLGDYALKNGYDGVICGHIHNPESRVLENGIHYVNLGCWTYLTNLTYAVDRGNGIELKKFEIS
jgi:UDP-2,3-diacylglucosamine pyrophosphatase LpxH